jgi:hypothetical protein
MAANIQSGAMMMREGLLFPESAHLDSSAYSPGWRTMTAVDSFGFERKLRDAGAHLFFLAGELKSTSLGRGSGALARGVRKVLALGRKQDLNCMQIAQVSPRRFLGLPYTVIRAYSFHIQKDSTLQTSAQRKLNQHGQDWPSA